jgi:hypothetical protein
MMSRGLRNTCSKKTVLAQVFAMQSISGACLQATGEAARSGAAPGEIDRAQARSYNAAGD